MTKKQKTLPQRAAAGDPVAWREMVDKYDRLVRYLVRRNANGEAHLYEDLVQDAWVYIIKDISKFDPSLSSLATWIHQMTIYSIHGGWSSRKPQREIEAEFCYAIDHPSEAENPEDAVARNETTALLSRVIDSMPDRQRQAARMAFIEGRDGGEIARIMGISKQRLSQMLYKGSSREMSAAETVLIEMPKDVV